MSCGNLQIKNLPDDVKELKKDKLKDFLKDKVNYKKIFYSMKKVKGTDA